MRKKVCYKGEWSYLSLPKNNLFVSLFGTDMDAASFIVFIALAGRLAGRNNTGYLNIPADWLIDLEQLIVECRVIGSQQDNGGTRGFIKKLKDIWYDSWREGDFELRGSDKYDSLSCEHFHYISESWRVRLYSKNGKPLS
jgi:hypothetical protein